MSSGSLVVLGISDGHSASAGVYVDDRMVVLLQEERLVREKNYCGPPEQAVAAALRLAGVQAGDVTEICYASRYVGESLRGPGAVQGNFDARYRSGSHGLRRQLSRLKVYRNWGASRHMARREALATAWGLDRTRVTFWEHHEAHAASAYYGLRQDEGPYLVLTLDGGGDGHCGSVWLGEGEHLRCLERIGRADSLGELYAVTTHLLGFAPLEHEYKLMGMAAYADPKYGEHVARIYSSYLGFDEKRPLRLRRRVPEPLSFVGPRLAHDLKRVRFDSVCAGLQAFTEALVAEWVRRCVEQTGVGRVLAAGGVFMNVKANKVVSELENVDSFEAFPSCGDESLSFGTCYLAARKRGTVPAPIQHCYLGSDLAATECREAAREAGNAVVVEEPADTADRVAEMLADGEIVARAAGPMEFGARALGNRSILADPINQDVVRVINQMIKKRDFWMPFAPVVLRRRADAYFRNPKGLASPYMMNTFDSTEKRGEFMAAVHNADLTARPQLLEEGQNPEYEAILERFGERTGRHVLLNTSFNLHGSPIVCSAREAMEVLLGSGLEHLVLGPLLVSKRLTAV